jgi:hypothetical protein
MPFVSTVATDFADRDSIYKRVSHRRLLSGWKDVRECVHPIIECRYYLTWWPALSK